MLRGIYNSGIGMNTGIRQLNIISNNLANADTTGFKKDDMTVGKFEAELSSKIGNKEVLTMDTVYTDYMQGSLDDTSNDFDLAIKGEGFFTVDRDGEKYTRDGSFALDKEGYLVTKDGFKVQGEKGQIKFAGDKLRINEAGEIFDGLVKIDKLKMMNFENLDSLEKAGDNLVKKTEQTVEKDCKAQVLQGFLETSNVNVVTEMVDMIEVMRNFEANQKVLKVHDEMLGKSANEIGKV